MTPSGTLPTSRLQKIDRWLGVPVCFGLTLLHRLAQQLNSPRPVHPAEDAGGEKILFIKLAEQGSTVLAQAAIRRAVELVGREHVYFVVFAENRFILDLLELIPPENVFTVNAGTVGSLLTSALQVLRRVWSMRFESAIDLEFFARSSAAFCYLTGAQTRVGFHTFFGEGPYRGNLMTHRLLYNPYLHTGTNFALMVEALRADPAQLPTLGLQPRESASADAKGACFHPSASEIEAVQTLFASADGAPLILLNANASDLLPLRRWAPDRYVELASRLLDALPEVHVAFTGAPSEATAAALLVSQVGSDRCFSLAGKTTLRQLLVLYTQAELLITNDSGPAHFASLTPIHVITLFGPETPRLFAARTPRNVALWSGVACSPCVNAYNNRQSPCRNNVCMQQISVDEVFTNALRVYQERRSQPAQIPA